jgi:hypothetical protein
MHSQPERNYTVFLACMNAMVQYCSQCVTPQGIQFTAAERTTAFELSTEMNGYLDVKKASPEAVADRIREVALAIMKEEIRFDYVADATLPHIAFGVPAE